MKLTTSGLGSLSLAAVLSAVLPAPLRAEDWSFDPGTTTSRAAAPVRFDIHASLSVADFSRPDSACAAPLGSTNATPGSGPVASAATGDFIACVPGKSTEVGIGLGGEAAFLVVGPLRLTMGVDFFYTEPSSELVRNQFIIAAPFGMLFSMDEWSFRPILRPKITPILYITDGVRDFSVGGDIGFAWRVLEWGDISLTLGLEHAQTLTSVAVRVGIHPL